MFCKKCGSQVPDDGRLCPYCGAPVIRSTNSTPSEQSYPKTTLNPQQSDGYKSNPQLTVCPFCKREVVDGNFCSKCSKPLHPKWYQKNSPLTIGLMIGSLLFLFVCVWIAVNVLGF